MEGEPFIEIDPTGRYGRYDDILGAGTAKKVYRAFDQAEGIEVAWNQVRIRGFSDDEAMIGRLFSEVRLLRTLRHGSIIAAFATWIDQERGFLNFITEVCSSGNLRLYREKHRHVSLMAVRNWLRQILKGLEYLHTHQPCIIHRDLNCSNVFINGNTGQVKIGDFGLAAIVDEGHAAHTVIGTPEFMAPELYEEDYTEAADVYAFGMCVLELMTVEMPYMECDSVVKIYKTVASGVKPRALARVEDPQFRDLIEECLAPQPERPSAAELLRRPLFADCHVDGEDDDENDSCFRLGSLGINA